MLGARGDYADDDDDDEDLFIALTIVLLSIRFAYGTHRDALVELSREPDPDAAEVYAMVF